MQDAERPDDRDDELEYLRSTGQSEIVANRQLTGTRRQIGLASLEQVMQTKKVWSGNGTFKTLLKATKTGWIHNMIHLDGQKFDFNGREYLKQIYNANYPTKLLKTGRQVEKCHRASSTVHSASGLEVQIKSLRPGDHIVALSATGQQILDRVVHSESNGVKPTLRIKTRLGTTHEVTLNHPLRKLLGWELAENLKVGDKIAALRSVGFFGSLSQPMAGLIGLLFGDGCFSSDGTVHQRSLGFTQKNKEVQDWFEIQARLSEVPHPKHFISKTSGSRQYWIAIQSPIGDWLKKYDLFGSVANTKTLPDEVFSYDKPSTQELLRGLWATDGHCKNVTPSKVDLVFCSTSEVLARQVRLLLRKFGVITVQRTYQPKKGELAYILRVVTRKSIEVFHSEIGPIPGKPFSIPTVDTNSNLDTVPKDIYPVIAAAKERAGFGGSGTGRCFEKEAGFRFKSNYAPTFWKLAEAQAILKDETIQTILDSDLVWDEIVSIEDAGEQETWAIQTTTETYVSDFTVQHNSTMLANEFIINSVIIPYFKSLYVSPSHDQTRQFSNGKLKPWIEDSPLINKYFQDSSVSKQVFEKSFTNGSIGFLRSAFLNADRTRGISADMLFLDEIQDILVSNVPVIEECLSHSKHGNKIFSGTPKTLENTIQQYWDLSSQGEWLVPCNHHSPPHYNFLDERCIGKNGPICNKCGNTIDPSMGRWVAFNDKRDIMGFRISQMMVPWIYQIPKKWKDFLFKYETYSKGQFNNEVLGISFDSASKPITRENLVACCSPKHPFRYQPDQWTRRVEVFAGVDWGEGTDGTERGNKGKMKNASYTILTLGTYIDPEHFHIFYYKKFTGKEAHPNFCVSEIIQIMAQFRVLCAGVDWGHGWGVNSQLETAFGEKRVIKFQYVGNQRDRKKWDDIGMKYQLGRTEVMTDFFEDIKKAKIVWPDWELVKDFLADFEHVYAEYNDKQALKYDHKSSEPDDVVHSSILCKEAADNYYGNKR
jgi:intein/homing endonuclease